MSIGKINEYTCDTCRMTIRTIDRDEGVTPFFLNCRATKGCGGTMHSAMYQVDQTYPPQFEWYKPAGKVKARDVNDKEYLKMGGLLIRPVEKA